MNLTWHIIKKDFRRLRPWLMLWWIVLLLRAVHPVVDFKLQVYASAWQQGDYSGPGNAFMEQY